MKTYVTLITGTLLALLCASCTKPESPTQEPVEQVVVEKKPPLQQGARKTQTRPAVQSVSTARTERPEPAATPASTNLFRTPADDIKLPTDAEIAEGKDTPAANGSPQEADGAPSISIKPPAPSTGPGQ